jgi:hypothetical protein
MHFRHVYRSCMLTNLKSASILELFQTFIYTNESLELDYKITITHFLNTRGKTHNY